MKIDLDYNINNMKTRKWYSTKVKPDRRYDLIIMTDMGYIFQACYEQDGWHVAKENNGKVYFTRWENQDSIIKWMKV